MKKIFRRFSSLVCLCSLGLAWFGSGLTSFAQDIQQEFRLINADGNQMGDRLIYDCGVFELADKEEAKEAFFFQIPADSLETLKAFGGEKESECLNVKLVGKRVDGTDVKLSVPVKFKKEPNRSLAFFVAREDLPDGTYEIRILDGNRFKNVKSKDEYHKALEEAVVGSFKEVVVAWRC